MLRLRSASDHVAQHTRRLTTRASRQRNIVLSAT